MSHFTFSERIAFPGTSAMTTLRELHEFAKQRLDAADLVLEFSRDVIHQLLCPRCGAKQDVFAPIGTISAAEGRCNVDGVMREVVTIHNFTGSESFGARTLSELGLPAFDLFVARTKTREVSLLIEGDLPDVLGPLASLKPIIWEALQQAASDSREQEQELADV
jgi:hypothetical protein